MADVIERMTDKFMTVLHEKRPDMGELESRRDAVKRPHEAMLAAVRELYEAALRTEVCTSYGYLRSVLDDHERRSEVKRGDS